jgi:hypothetical protein
MGQSGSKRELVRILGTRIPSILFPLDRPEIAFG